MLLSTVHFIKQRFLQSLRMIISVGRDVDKLRRGGPISRRVVEKDEKERECTEQ